MSNLSPLGVNLEPVCDWDRSRTYINLFKHARPLGSAANPWDENPGPIDPATRYPVGDFGAMMVADGPVQTGTYTFACKGRCTKIASQAKVENLVYSAEHDETYADLVMTNATGPFTVALYGSKLSDVRVRRPGYLGDAQTFTNEFLRMIEPFGGLRCMDILATNGNPLVRWSDRPLPTDPCYGFTGSGKVGVDRGVPYEDLIFLANHTGKALWLCVPYNADADYIAQLATLLKRTLRPGIPVYLELSNEVWNWQFAQAQDNLRLAKEWAAARPDVRQWLKTINGGTDDDNGYRWAYYAERVVQMGKHFRTNPDARVILAGQVAWLDGINVGLGYVEKFVGPVKNHVYAVAGAPYFGADTGDINVVAAEARKIASDKNVGDLLVLAERHGIRAVCYEGGIDLHQGENQLAAKVAMQSDPRIYDICRSNLDGWFDRGGHEFFWFGICGEWNRWGVWGATEDPQKLDGPKYRALADVALARTPTEPPMPATKKLVGLTLKFSDGTTQEIST